MRKIASHQKAIGEMEAALQRMKKYDDFLWSKQPMPTLMGFTQAMGSLEYVEEHFEPNPQPPKRTA